MKKILGYTSLLLLICFLASVAFAGHVPLKGSNQLETKLGGIKLFDTKRTVYQRLGKPIKLSYDNATDSTDIYYKGLKFELDSNGYVIEIESTSGKFSTQRGIKLGDKKAKIVKRYGIPSLEGNDKRQTYLQYNSSKYQGWVYCLRFYVSKGKVTKISCFDPWGNGL